MGTKKRGTKGTVSLQELTHTRRFKYRYQCHTYYLTLPRIKSPLELFVQEVIKQDIINGMHDNSLGRYKKLLVSDKHEQPNNRLKNASTKKLGLADSLKKFLETTGRSMGKDLYYYTYRMVLNWGDGITCEMIPQKLTSMKYSSKTFNNRKLVLRVYCDWLVRNKVLEFNPLEDLPSRRKTGSKSSKRRRLTDIELTQILDAIKNNQFVSVHSKRYKHSDYYPIFYFLASTVNPTQIDPHCPIQIDPLDYDHKNKSFVAAKRVV